jgi:hypothetical protein
MYIKANPYLLLFTDHSRMKKVLSSQQIKLEIQLKVKPDKILITDPWPLGLGSSQEVIFCELRG